MGIAPDGEKRWTVILSTDMVGFTQITQNIGNEQTYALLQEVLEQARRVIEGFGGHVIDTAGDGLLAAFGAPQALEDAPVMASRAALDFHAQIADGAGRYKRRYGVVPQFRSGIAAGNAMIARTGDQTFKVVGDAVNLAARLQDLASSDEILITKSIQQDISGFIACKEKGEALIKGFEGQTSLFALTGRRGTVSRFDGSRQRGLAEFVSRQNELNEALSVLSTNTKDATLFIKGVAGVGKSRLTHEILRRLPEHRPVFLGQCAPVGQTNLGPAYQILNQAIAAPAEASHEEILRKFDRVHPGVADPAILQTVLAADDPDGDPFNRALQERELLAGLLRWLCKNTSAVLVIEDAHWVDSATDDLIATLSAEPLPLLVTARPSYAANWTKGPAVHGLTLDPLEASDMRQFVADQFDETPGPTLTNLIVDKSEGIPLIAEEVARTLRQGDALHKTTGGLELKGDHAALVSGNLEQLILSRIDALAPDQKRQLQIAAAMGRDFDIDLLAEAASRDVPLKNLDGLVSHQQGSAWRFSHALIRDAVYGSLLSGQRADIHAKIAAAMETRGRTEDAALLAEHFLQANTNDKAVRYLVQAARQAYRVYALREVDQHCQRAWQLVPSGPAEIDTRVFGELATTWFSALDQAALFYKILQIGGPVVEKLTELGLAKQKTFVETLMAMAMTHTRQYRESEALAKSVLKRAEAEGDQHGAAWAKTTLMRIYEETGWLPPNDALSLADDVVTVAAAKNDSYLEMTALYLRTALLRSGGRYKDALVVVDALEEISRTRNDRRAKGYACWARALIHVLKVNPEAAYEVIQAGKSNALAGTSDAHVIHGIELFCKLFTADPDTLNPQFKDLRDRALVLPDTTVAHSMDWHIVVNTFRQGRLGKGWRKLNQLIPIIEDCGHIALIRQFHMLKAEILLTIAGLIDPADEAPPGRPVFAPKKPNLHDTVTYLWLRPQAKRLATQTLQHIIEIDLAKHGAFFARAKIGLGLIAEAAGDKINAVALLREGYENAMQEDLDVIAARALPPLQRLGGI